MSALFDAILPLASTVMGGSSGFFSARAQQLIEVQDRKDERESEERIVNLKLAHGKDAMQSTIDIKPTYHERFIGIRCGDKRLGIEFKSKAQTLLMSPVNVFKFGIAFMFAYTYCYIWQYNAHNPQEVVRTLLPEPAGWSVDLFGLKYAKVIHVISELNLGGLAATTMASAPIFIVTYVVTNLTYKQLARK